MNSTLPYYSIRPSLLIQEIKDGSFFNNYKLNIILGHEAEFTPQLYSIVNKLGNKCIISLSAHLLKDLAKLQHLLPEIYTLLALNKISAEKRVLPVLIDGREQPQFINIEVLQNYLIKQGLTGIQLPVFNCSENGLQTVDDCSLFVVKDQLKEVQYAGSEMLSNSGMVNITFSYELIKEIEINEPLINNINDFERYRVINSAIPSGNTHEEELNWELELWKRRTGLYKEFLSLSKHIQEQEYYDLHNWYKNEYEILPLWYKRFGHIIKVIMGKRSFKSLFSDKVKKYRD